MSGILLDEAAELGVSDFAELSDEELEVLDMLHEVALEKRDYRVAETWLKATGVLGQLGRGSSLLDEAAELGVSDFAELSDEELEVLRAQIEADSRERDAIQRAKEMV